MTAAGRSGNPIPWLNGLRVVRAVMVFDLVGWAMLLTRHDFAFSINHGYDLLSQWATPHHWASGFVLAALFASLTGRLASRPLAALSAGVCCFMQSALAVTFTFGPYVTTGAPTHIALALAGSWLVWRELFG